MRRLAIFWAVAAAFVLFPSGITQASETVTYEYDELGRLEKVVKSGTALTSGQEVTTSYDPAGNRANYAVTGATGGPNAPVIALTNNPSATEGGTLSFTLSASPAPTISTSVNYATANGTAIAPTNYAANSGTITFAANKTSAQISVATANDGVTTPNLTMTVNLSAPTAGGTLGTASATGSIVDTANAPLFIVVPLNGYTLIKVGGQ